jgi:methyl-accepting chemotaxis protein
MKIRTRLFLSFSLLIIFIIGVGAFAMFQMNILSSLTTKLYRHPFTVTNTVRKININIAEIRSAMKSLALAKDDALLQETIQKITAYDQEVYDCFKIVKERFLGDQQDVDNLIKIYEEWKPIREKTLALKKEGKHEEVMLAVISGAGASQYAKLREAMKVVTDFADNKAAEFLANARLQKERSFLWLSVIMVLAALLGMGVAWAISRSIIRPLKSAVEVANAIAAGNLHNQIPVTTKDETGQLLQALVKMQMQLREIILVIKRTAEVVTTSAQEISQGNANLSQRTTQESASLQETAASMEEMTSSVQQNSDNTKQAAQLALGARNHAIQGGEVVGTAIRAINEISHSSQKVTEIIGVINEIAFQTNLLALNAAVEAARAGEHGRGFAVVATEVRNLAQRSAAAAKEIKVLIRDSVVKVEEGTKLANKSGEALTEIVTAVKKVSDIIAEIAVASQEQTASINQIHKAINQLDEVTQHNAAMVEEIAAASTAMSEQAQKLKQQVAFFKVSEQELLQQATIEEQSTVINRPTHPPEDPKLRKQPVFQSREKDNGWQEF